MALVTDDLPPEAKSATSTRSNVDYPMGRELSRAWLRRVRWVLSFADGIEWPSEDAVDAMILDDDVCLLVVFAFVLERSEYRPISVDTAEAALEELRRNTPAVALIDFNMVSGNSLAVADALEAMGIPFAFLRPRFRRLA